MMRTRVIDVYDNAVSIRRKWDDLVEHGKLDVSASYLWTIALWESHLKKKNMNIILVENGTDILGIFPVFLKKKTMRKLPITTVCSVASLFCLHNDLVVHEPTHDILSAFFEGLKSISGFRKWNVMEIPSVVVGGIADLMLKSFLSANGYKYIVSKGPVSPFIITKDLSWEEYLKSLKKKARGNFKRKQNIIRREGATIIKQLSNYDEILNIMTQVESRSWKHRSGSAMVDNEHQMTFYKLLMKNFGSRFIFFALFFNDKPICFSMGLLYRNKYYSLKTSYNSDYKKVSPGIVLRLNLLQYCFDNEFYEFDFCGEEEQWKKEFTIDHREHKNYIIFNKDIYSRFIYLISQFIRKNRD